MEFRREPSHRTFSFTNPEARIKRGPTAICRPRLVDQDPTERPAQKSRCSVSHQKVSAGSPSSHAGASMNTSGLLLPVSFSSEYSLPTALRRLDMKVQTAHSNALRNDRVRGPARQTRDCLASVVPSCCPPLPFPFQLISSRMV